MGKKMKIDKLRGKLILKNPKIIDPLNETIFQNDVMLDNNKICLLYTSPSPRD